MNPKNTPLKSKVLKHKRSGMEDYINDTQKILSGSIVQITGYYAYDGHTDFPLSRCVVTPQASRLLFQKNQTAPKLDSCDHNIKWKLLKAYE